MATANLNPEQLHRPDPLDAIEQLLVARGWGYERIGEEERLDVLRHRVLAQLRLSKQPQERPAQKPRESP